MTDTCGEPCSDPDLTERALALIATGRTLAAPVVDDQADPDKRGLTPQQIAVLHRDLDADETLRSYFRRARRADVVAELQVLEGSQTMRPSVVQEATKWLAAYFRWTASENAPLTCDQHAIEPLASRFAIAVSTRLAGPLRDPETTLPASVLPVWTSPDMAFGWRRPRGRPTKFGIDSRSEGIAAMWVKLEAAGVDSASREQRVSQAFGIRPTVIYDVLRENADIVAAFSTAEGLQIVDEVIAKSVALHRRSGK